MELNQNIHFQAEEKIPLRERPPLTQITKSLVGEDLPVDFPDSLGELGRVEVANSTAHGYGKDSLGGCLRNTLGKNP